jgi:hypothetical protein
MQSIYLKNTVHVFFSRVSVYLIYATEIVSERVAVTSPPSDKLNNTSTPIATNTTIMAGNPPTKKRRVETSESIANTFLSGRDPSPAAPTSFNTNSSSNSSSNNDSRNDTAFDYTTITAIIGEELSRDILRRLRDVSGGNMERGEKSCHDMSES